MRRFVWETLRFREEHVEDYFPADVKKTTIASRAFYNLKPGNVVVPTAVKSHIANGMLRCACRLLRGLPSRCFVSLLSSAWGLGF